MKLPHPVRNKVERIRLDLPVLAPNVQNEANACVDRLVDVLAGGDGIYQVHVVPASGDVPAKLRIHYRPEVSLGRIKEIAEGAGARVTAHGGPLRTREPQSNSSPGTCIAEFADVS